MAKMFYILKFGLFEGYHFKGRNNFKMKYPVKSPNNLKQSLSWTLLSYKTKYVQYMPGTDYKHALCC